MRILKNPQQLSILPIGQLLSFFVLFWSLLSGCSNSRAPSPIEIWAAQDGRVKVLSTTAMIDDIVGQIGQDRISHIALITGEIDPHNYELVKGDDEKLSLAQVIFYNGLGLEHGASLRYQLEHHTNAVDLGNTILHTDPELIIHVDKEIDPHIWMDISLWSRIIDPIVDALCAIDPAGSEVYRNNAELLRKKMMKEHFEIYRALQNIPQEKRYLVTSHDAFNYFARRYLASPDEKSFDAWKRRFDAPEGLSPEGQLSASDIQEVIAYLIKYNIQIVFPESNVSRDSLRKVVNACAHKGLVVKISNDALYGDAMGPKGSDVDTYLKMIRHDANVLIQAWQSS